jgi:hypothetical protein
VREDPIFSGGWIKAALVILVAGALGVGAYVLASGVNIDLPDLPETGTSGAETTLSNTTLENTTIGEETKPAPAAKPAPQTQTAPATPTIQRLQELNRCTEAAGGDIDKITQCFDRFNSGR